MASIASWSASRPVKSCTECKQSKLRCDSKSKFPGPCSRCQARRLSCTVDPAFRRTPARKRLEAMSKELRELRERQGRVGGSQSSPARDSAQPEDLATGSCPDGMSDATDHNVALNVELLQLEGVVVSGQAAVEAFQIFVTYFYPQFPITGPIDLKTVYESTPFLFWTVIVIVACQIPGLLNDPLLFSRLKEPYMTKLRGEVLMAPLSLHQIQALLYLCMWPLPVRRQPEEPSWMYCGLAVNSALYMGLHRPNQPPGSFRAVGVASGTELARGRTWLGCFYVSTCLSMHLGLPPSIGSAPDLAMIHTFLGRLKRAIPREFALQVRVQHVVASFGSVIAQGPGHGDGGADSALVRLLDSDLERLRADFPDDWTDLVEAAVLVARLHFYIMAMTRATPPASTAGRVLRTLGLTAAVRVVDLAAARLREETVPSAEEGGRNPTAAQLLRTLPKHYLRGLAFATIFLLRFFGRSSAADVEERRLADEHIVAARGLFRACAREPGDEHNRVATFLDLLSRHALFADVDGAAAAGTPARQTGRVGLSGVVLDAIGSVYEARGKLGSAPGPSDYAVPSTTSTLAAQAEVEEEEAPVGAPTPLLDNLASDMQGLEPWLAGPDSSYEFLNEMDPMLGMFGNFEDWLGS